MVARRDVVLLQVGGFQGTGFLIAPDKLATALHVIAQLENDRVVRDSGGLPVSMGPITCTYFTEQRGRWHEQVEFVPSSDAWSIAGDWAVVNVRNADGVRVWRCTTASLSDRLCDCTAYGFPPVCGAEGAPYTGELTGVSDPWQVDAQTTVQLHRAWFREAVSPTGLCPVGFSGAPVVLGDHVVGIVRSFISSGGGQSDSGAPIAVGATVMLTPIEAVLIELGIEPAAHRPSPSGSAEKDVAHIDTRGSELLMDNWLLQSVAGLMNDGPDGDAAQVIEIDRAQDTHRFNEVSAAGIEFESLMSLLNDLVFRERLVLDREFMDTWHGKHAQLDALIDSGALGVREIDNRARLFGYAKGRVIKMLCATSSLARLNEESRETFRANRSARSSLHRHISAVIAGTGGNFGRSAITRIPYSPHPVRQRLIEQTVFCRPTAVDLVTSWLESERANIHAYQSGASEILSAQLVLPALAVQIILDSNTREDLIPVALQYRDRYARLRAWIGAYQDAIDDEDVHAIQKRRRVLESVAQHLAGMRGDSRYGITRILVETGRFGFGHLLQKVGVRGALNGLVATPAGEPALRKLLAMFELARTSLEYRVREHLWSRFRGTGQPLTGGTDG